MLFYCPLEPLRERYTSQLSAPQTGWFEREWLKAGIKYRRVNGREVNSYQQPGTIAIGQVLDAPNRCRYAFSQIDELLWLAQTGELKSDDVIYFDDFWHPGMEALGYCFSQMNLKPKMYAFCWAQSVDEFDFTYSMASWMQHYERGNMRLLEGVFVANSLLKYLLTACRGFAENRVHVVGLPFCSQEVMERMPGWYQAKMADGNQHAPLAPRQDRVVFSSRWDDEKNPLFFLEVAERVLQERGGVEFVVCTSAPTLRSNNPSNIEALYKAMDAFPGRVVLKENLSKEQYYEELCTAKVQMNTANQDWISFTLLEASVAGCFPVYPNFRSFPETFEVPYGQSAHLYQHLNAESATKALMWVLSAPEDVWSSDSIRMRSWIHKRFDSTWARQAKIMGVWDGEPEVKDPFEGSTAGDRTPS